MGADTRELPDEIQVAVERLTLTLHRSERTATDVVLVAPGLNNNVHATQPLIAVLNGSGYDCLSVRLQFGRRLSSDEIAREWVAAIADAYAVARDGYRQHSIHSVAYSLGALTTLMFLQDTPAASLERLFLIAPPLALTRSAGLVRHLTPLRHVGAALPSLAPRSIRERAFTTLADYHAMLTLVNELNRIRVADNIRRAQVRCIVSAKDEMVDAAGVRAWIQQQGLDWTVRTLGKNLTGSGPHHLLLSERSMGSEGWRALTGEMLAHFSHKPR